MSDQELISKLSDLADKLEACHINAEGKRENNGNWLRGLVFSVIVLVVCTIYYGGKFVENVEHLQKSVDDLEQTSISIDAWTNNEYKTNASYNKVFEIPSEYQTRGGASKQ